MQERLVYKALLLKELVLSILLIVNTAVVVIVVILAVFLFSPASLIILAGVLNPFIFYKVY
jgi:hypothetical protein